VKQKGLALRAGQDCLANLAASRTAPHPRGGVVSGLYVMAAAMLEKGNTVRDEQRRSTSSPV